MTETSVAPVSPVAAAGWRLEHTYAQLPSIFHARVLPTPVAQPRLVLFNHALARELGLDAEVLDRPEAAPIFAGNALPEGAQPLAQAYAGHQYGNFIALGDGRAILLGEQITPAGCRFDIQLKGPGPTPYSRRGDGRAALGPMLREYIISEAMQALGIPTTRSLAVATTGEPVYREEVLQGAVLTRVAASHLRVGTFEWAAAHQEPPLLRALADYTIQRHDPELAATPHPYRALLDAIVERQAQLVARWQLVGFVHGVMNTDNMALSGETIDYGPCAFMEAYDPATVFSSIDRHGRYAYGNQPRIAQWNLARLAESLLPLLHAEPDPALELAQAAIERFDPLFERHWLHGLRAKLGWFDEREGDRALIEDLFLWMRRASADFTNTFRELSTGRPPAPERLADGDFAVWHRRWEERLGRQSQSREESLALRQRHNPAFIPRNHRVEEALDAAARDGDLGPTRHLLEVLARPFDYTHERPEYQQAAPAGCGRYRTFCGT